ncbi:MAG: serine hydrolase [Chitinophagaceae bacterium]
MKFVFSVIFLWCAVTTLAQRKNQTLQAEVENICKGFHGVVGVHILHLPSGKTVSVNADTVFPTASMIKIPILIGIMDKIRNSSLDYHSNLVYRDSLLYPGEDILGSFKDSSIVSLSKVMMLMLTTSDNTASLWLQALAGGGTRINTILDSAGFKNTRVNSRTQGREEFRKKYGWGQTTPREMVELMAMIYRRKMLDEKSSTQMLRLLGRNYWDEQAISEIPPDVFVASKNGAVDASRSETLLVMAPSSPYIFSIITKEQQDTSWGNENEGWVVAKKLSALLWKYYSKKS